MSHYEPLLCQQSPYLQMTRTMATRSPVSLHLCETFVGSDINAAPAQHRIHCLYSFCGALASWNTQHIIIVTAQACQKELSQQKAAYEQAITEILEKQRGQIAKAAKESAAEALRSHPLAETPPREPRAPAHACPLGDVQPPRMPVLRTR